MSFLPACRCRNSAQAARQPHSRGVAGGEAEAAATSSACADALSSDEEEDDDDVDVNDATCKEIYEAVDVVC